MNQVIGNREPELLELSVHRNRQYGDDAWVTKTDSILRLDHTIRTEGRSKKVIEKGAT
ncbi:MAG: hypothetical protein IT447_12320 [Phycisphaerales bacterium]|nr:hypothetical protein [Phycisphaerales bacterium]